MYQSFHIIQSSCSTDDGIASGIITVVFDDMIALNGDVHFANEVEPLHFNCTEPLKKGGALVSGDT